MRLIIISILRIRLSSSLFLLGFTLLLSPPPAHSEASWTIREALVMGTYLTIQVKGKDEKGRLEASENILRFLEEKERVLSTWDPHSPLSHLNAAPPGAWVSLPLGVWQSLEKAKGCAELTRGAFNLGLGRLVQVWGLREGGRTPDPASLQKVLPGLDYHFLEVKPGAARRLHEDFLIEEGGFGKGAALEALKKRLDSLPIEAAVIELGGQVLLFGLKKPMPLQLAHPKHREKPYLTLQVASGCLATSGNSEKAFHQAGKTFGHILNPWTGIPAPDFGSLTVWSEDCFLADCLSTGFYVLGPQAALKEALKILGVEVLILKVSGNQVTLLATPGFSGKINIQKEVLP